MNITINIDCTPQEARAFFGLPNVEPMQDALVERMQNRLETYMDRMEPDALLKFWFTNGIKDLGAFQEQLWKQFMETMTGAAAAKRKAGE